jgi:hypothetical protein
MNRAIRMPMMVPMRMANGVDSRRGFLVGCMGLAGCILSLSRGGGVGPGRRERGARAEATTASPRAGPLDRRLLPHHVRLFDLVVPEHASRAPLSATEVGPFAPVATAGGEKFCVHRTTHAGHPPLRDTLLGGQTPVTAEPAHPRSAKSHMAHPRPLPFCPFVHPPRPSFTSQPLSLLPPPSPLVLLCRAAPNKLS